MCTLEPCTLHKHIHIFCLPLHEWLELFTFTVHVYSMRKLTNCAQVHSSRNFFLFNLYSIHIAKCWIYIVINPLDEHQTKNWKKNIPRKIFTVILLWFYFYVVVERDLMLLLNFYLNFTPDESVIIICVWFQMRCFIWIDTNRHRHTHTHSLN